MPFKNTKPQYITAARTDLSITALCLPKDKRKRRRMKRRMRKAKEAFKELIGGVVIYGRRNEKSETSKH